MAETITKWTRGQLRRFITLVSGDATVATVGAVKVDDLTDASTNATDSTSPTTGQVLAWSEDNARWEPANVGDTEPVTALNNRVANTLVTIGSTTTELDGEASLTYDNTNGLAVGTNGAGKDVRFWSDTNGASFFWDSSDEKLLVNGVTNTTSLHVNTGDVLIDDDLSVTGRVTTRYFTLNGTAVTASAAELNIMYGVTATTTELNILAGATSATGTTLEAADRVVVNHGGTMYQVAMSDFETFMESNLDTMGSQFTSAASLATVGTIGTGVWAATDVAVAHGGTGASSATAAATNLGLGTGDNPLFGTVSVGNADTTLARSGAGDLTIEGNAIYRAGGTDVAIADGGTGAGTAAAAATALGVGAANDVVHGSLVIGTDGATAGDIKIDNTNNGEIIWEGSTADGNENILRAADGGGINTLPASTGTILTTAAGITVEQGGTGASSLTDGGVLLGSDTGAITAMAVLQNSEMIVGDGSTDPVAESGGTLRTSIGVGTGNSPQFTGVELGHASDTTLTRSSAGVLAVEGTIVLLAGAQTSITTDYNTGRKIGRDADNLIDFATTDNKLIFRVEGVDEVELVQNALSPVTNSGVALGTTSLGWSDLHLATEGVINWANGEMTITETANDLAVAGGTMTVNGGVKVDNITIDGTEIDLSSGDLTLDVAGDINIDADGDHISLKFGAATGQLDFTNTNSGDIVIQQKTDGKDIVFLDHDGSTEGLRILDAGAGIRTAAGGEVQTRSIGYTDGDNALTIADGGGVTAAAGLTSTAASNLFGATSFNDAAITHVTDISLDSISADDTDINIAVSDNSATALTIKQGSDAYLIIDTANSSESVSIGTGISGTAISIGHTTSETTVNDNLVVTGNLTVSGDTVTTNVSNVIVADPLFLLSSGATGTPSVDSGLVIERGDLTNVTVLWDESADTFVFGETSDTGTTAGNVTISDYAPLRVGALTADDNSTFSAGASFGDANITNVADIALATISADNGSSFAMGSNWTNAGRTVADGGIVTTIDINGGSIDGTVIGANVAAAGTFAAIVGTSLDVTDGDITNVGDIDCDTISVADAGNGLQVQFGGATGTNKITLTDDLAEALTIEQNGNDYLKFVSSDGAEKIIVSKALDIDSSVDADISTFSAVCSSTAEITVADGNDLTLGNAAKNAYFMVAAHSSAGSEDIRIINTEGTDAKAIEILATAGGVSIECANEKEVYIGNNDKDAHVTVAASATPGNEDIRIVNTAGTDAKAIEILASAGGVAIECANEKEVYIGNDDKDAYVTVAASSTPSNEDIRIINTAGTDTKAIEILASAGGVAIECANEKEVYIGNDDKDAYVTVAASATPGNEDIRIINTAGTDAKAVEILASAGGVAIECANEKEVYIGNDDKDAYVTVAASGTPANEDVRIVNTAGTDAKAIEILASAGGVSIECANEKEVYIGNDDKDAYVTVAASGTPANEDIRIVNTAGTDTKAIEILAAAGGVSIECADGKEVYIGNNDKDAYVTVAAHGTVGSEDIRIVNTNGTDAAAIEVTATAGGILLNVDAAAKKIHLDSEGSVDIDAIAGLSIDCDGAAANFTVTADATGEDLTIAQAGSVNASVHISSAGTADDALTIKTTAGGIDIQVAGAAAGEDLDISSNTSVNITASEAADDAIVLNASSGGVDINANAARDVTIDGGQIKATAAHNVAESIKLHADAGANQTIVVVNDEGTSESAIAITSTAGGVDIDANAAKDVTINGGQVVATAAHNVAGAIKLHADAGASQTIVLLNDEGTSESAVAITSTAGGVDIDANAAKDVTINGGQVVATAAHNVASAIKLHADAGANQTILLVNDEGTDAGAVEVTSTAGGILLNVDTVTKKIHLDSEGFVDIDSPIEIKSTAPLVTDVHDFNTTAPFSLQAFDGDGDGGGRIIKFEPGSESTLTLGGLYFLHTDGTWDAVNADNPATGASQLLGIAMGTSARSDGMLLNGFVRIPSTQIEALSAGSCEGKPLYISEASGRFDFNPPDVFTYFVRVVGYALEDNGSDVLVYFNPDPTWVEIS